MKFTVWRSTTVDEVRLVYADSFDEAIAFAKADHDCEDWLEIESDSKIYMAYPVNEKE